MKIKELERLSLGTYEVTNGLYTYTLEKKLSIRSLPIYSLRVKGNPWYYGNVMFFEDTVKYENENFFRKTLKSLSGIDGFAVHSNYTDFMRSLGDLKLIPRGSFQEFINRTK